MCVCVACRVACGAPLVLPWRTPTLSLCAACDSGVQLPGFLAEHLQVVRGRVSRRLALQRTLLRRIGDC
jgi:hypothetical protein